MSRTDPSPTRRARTVAASVLVGALALSGIGLTLPAQAAVSTDAKILINEVYGGAQNGGAVLRNDFIELVNVGDAPQDLSQWSLQYASVDGSSWNAQRLSGSIQPGKTFLVAAAAATGSGASALPALPTPDATISTNLSGTTGKVALVNSPTALTGATGNATGSESVVDFVGYGSGATDFAGTPAPAPSGANSISRSAFGNTADNGADFVAGPPTPQNSGSVAPTPEPTATSTPTATPTPTSTPTQTPAPTPGAIIPIAQIQGTGTSTPLNGQTVTTEGIVTAHYPTGGLNGYVVQTPGTGGTVDFATHTASDAIFVYAPGGRVNDVQLGQTVRVTGQATEFNGLTQIAVQAGGAQVIADGEPIKPLVVEWPSDEVQREALESMLLQPAGEYTVTDDYNSHQYAEVVLAFGSEPLKQPTDIGRPGSPEAAAEAASHAGRTIVLDDGASTNFLTPANSTLIPPYLSLTEPVRVGASVTFNEPVIVDYRNDTFKVNPTRPLVGDGSGKNDGVTFENTRTHAPASVGGDLSVASFNVLNYFTTLGEGTSCRAYTSPNGQELNNVRDGCDQRGAWDAQDLARQQAKIVSAINALDASVVGLMEIENSARLGDKADEATETLVAALNAAAGSTKWAFVPSSNDLPDAAQMDVISNAIIYQPALVDRVGDSRALGDQSGAGQAFQNAREPIAQRFAPKGGGEEFFFVVNHFKSKGSVGPWPGDADQGDGQGTSNESRERQATALTEWVKTVTAAEDAVVLAGDFNSYTQEDPMDILYRAGYANAATAFDVDGSSYLFQRQVGSLDHVLLNEVAHERATGADIWNINSVEALALEYSRYKYTGFDFHADDPYRSSDHDPVKVGLASGKVEPTEIDIVTINDFHGRLEADAPSTSPTTAIPGAAVLAAGVKAQRAENPNTLFVSAGDNIGASTFTSFIQDDNPTIDTLVASGLDVSAVGNHEFDRGFGDLVDRVIPRFGGNTGDEVTAEQRAAGADFGLGANVYAKGTVNPVLPEYAIKEVDGVRVAFIGTVTTDTAQMVDPAGIADIEFGDQLVAANRVSKELVDEDLADVIVLLTHSGSSASNNCGQVAAEASDFGALVRGASADIDAIVSAHTHQTYACEVPVAGTETLRPVLQASEYGKALGKLELSYDSAKDELLSISASTKQLWQAYPADADIAAKVATYVAEGNVKGAVPVGTISGSILRGGATPSNDRGVESTAGNSVADWYLWATSVNPSYGGEAKAQIAFMNPGGLRADIVRSGDGVVTYKQVANVQPFANTLVTLTLTGAQIEAILDRQWQKDGDRPKLHLGVSEGFTYEYTEAGPRSGKVVAMYYQGERITADQTFTVVTNSFLANGGDGFLPFADGTNRKDTGQVDLEATVAYFASRDVVDPSPIGRATLVTGSTPTPTPTGSPEPTASPEPTGSPEPTASPEPTGSPEPTSSPEPTGTPTGSPQPTSSPQPTAAPSAGISVSGLVSGGRIEAGASFTISLSGLKPFEQVTAVLYSDPIVISGIPAADAAGAVTFRVTVPADLAQGAHRLVVLGDDGRVVLDLPITVVAPGALAATGTELPLGLALGGAFLLVAGGLLFTLRRRSMTAS